MPSKGSNDRGISICQAVPSSTHKIKQGGAISWQNIFY